MTNGELDAGTEKLVTDLQALPRSYDRDEIITRALKGRYHDYKAKHAAPKLLLVEHLTRARMTELAKRAMSGRYDQDKAASDEWMESEAGQEALADTEAREKAAAIWRSITGEDPPDERGSR